MAAFSNRVGSGISALDETIDQYRLGDNVVWQTDSIEDYCSFVEPFVQKSLSDGRKVIYIRFGSHMPLVDDPNVKVYTPHSHEGFEHFTSQIYNIITDEGHRAFYVFDCLTELLDKWCSDLMIGNFFRITCPYLFELDTIAYFAILRDRHSVDTVARIRETTQILIDVYNIDNDIYVHPLKAWERYSTTMFLPHKYENDAFIPLTGSVENAMLFSRRINKQRGFRQIDYWDRLFLEAQQLTDKKETDQMFDKILSILIGKSSKINKLAKKYFALSDLIDIKNRQIGTGYIGGKSVGMLLSRKIVESDNSCNWNDILEHHDSFYLGSDVYYTYLVQNGYWKLRMAQNTESGYFEYAPMLQKKLKTGVFPAAIREQFQQMLEHFGQSPIIVRSSSLLEDNYGNAFAGKYESVFCVNQGTPEQRYEKFEEAVRTVYASMMNEDALNYRLTRGLQGKDEQMALLVQRVSGDYHKNYFFPTLAGMGNSSNLYVWDKKIDPSAGMLRLVFGLGTRAVDRAEGDYPRIVCLDLPTLLSVAYEDRKQFSQHYADVLDLKNNELATVPLSTFLYGIDIDIDISLFGEEDYDGAKRLKELKIKNNRPFIMTFENLLEQTNFPKLMRDILRVLEKAYSYPVDIEYTVNFTNDNEMKINLLQCRPLQTKGLGRSISLPQNIPSENILFSLDGNFMGGNVRLPISRIIYVRPRQYSELPEREKYSIARIVGKLNKLTSKESCPTLLLGPGRWGTTTPSLGVPISFAEINNISVMGEVAFGTASPELSYGSHFFQDLVESGIFYVALFPEKENVVFKEDFINSFPNMISDLLEDGSYSEVIHVCDTEKIPLEIYSDIVSQRCVCVKKQN